MPRIEEITTICATGGSDACCRRRRESRTQFAKDRWPAASSLTTRAWRWSWPTVSPASADRGRTESQRRQRPFLPAAPAHTGYRLRFKQPDVSRPYRCWGYPVTPALYLAICLAFLVYVVQGDPLATMFGLLLVLTGIPFYVMWKAQAIGRST